MIDAVLRTRQLSRHFERKPTALRVGHLGTRGLWFAISVVSGVFAVAHSRCCRAALGRTVSRSKVGSIYMRACRHGAPVAPRCRNIKWRANRPAPDVLCYVHTNGSRRPLKQTSSMYVVSSSSSSSAAEAATTTAAAAAAAVATAPTRSQWRRLQVDVSKQVVYNVCQRRVRQFVEGSPDVDLSIPLIRPPSGGVSRGPAAARVSDARAYKRRPHVDALQAADRRRAALASGGIGTRVETDG